MGAPQFVLRIIVATIAVLTVGTIAVFGFNVVEPFYGAFGEPPASLGWGNPSDADCDVCQYRVRGYAPVYRDLARLSADSERPTAGLPLVFGRFNSATPSFLLVSSAYVTHELPTPGVGDRARRVSPWRDGRVRRVS